MLKETFELFKYCVYSSPVFSVYSCNLSEVTRWVWSGDA